MSTAEQMIQEDISCPLGCERNDEIVLTGRDLLHDLPGEFGVLRCRACGLMRTNPRPSPSSMGLYYPDDYGPYIGTQVRSNQFASGFKEKFKSLIKKIFETNAQKLPKLPPGRMLEIGCASGAFLHHMANRDWQVQGIEFSDKAAQVAARLGYRVHAGPLETAPKPDEPFDLIVGWMVLEHLHDPVGGLRKLREWAEPGAWLVLSVPNAASLEFRLFGSKWYALQLPTHLHHFTPATLEKLLLASGWRMEKVHHQRTLSNLIASIGYILQDRGYPNVGRKFIDFVGRVGVLTMVLFPISWLFSLFGETGRMTVWARIK